MGEPFVLSIFFLLKIFYGMPPADVATVDKGAERIHNGAYLFEGVVFLYAIALKYWVVGALNCQLVVDGIYLFRQR